MRSISSCQRAQAVSLGTKNKSLKPDANGSLTMHVRTYAPAEVQRSNWLPAPKGDFSLSLRAYRPRTALIDGSWVPPAVQKAV